MAILYVSEFTALWSGVTGQLGQMANGGPVASQTVVIGGGSLQSATFGAATKFIRVHTDVICSIAIGPNPVAVASAMRMAANQTEYFGVGANSKIAVISNV